MSQTSTVTFIHKLKNGLQATLPTVHTRMYNRAILMAPLWPGDQINMESDLTEVLAALLPLFTTLMTRGSNTY